MLLGCDTGCLCLQFDLLTVLIGTGLEENIITFFSLETRNAVSQYDLVVITDMGLGGRIGNGSCKIIFPLLSINLILLFLKIKARLLKEHEVLQEDEHNLVLPLLFVPSSRKETSMSICIFVSKNCFVNQNHFEYYGISHC